MAGIHLDLPQCSPPDDDPNPAPRKLRAGGPSVFKGACQGIMASIIRLIEVPILAFLLHGVPFVQLPQESDCARQHCFFHRRGDELPGIDIRVRHLETAPSNYKQYNRTSHTPVADKVGSNSFCHPRG